MTGAWSLHDVFGKLTIVFSLPRYSTTTEKQDRMTRAVEMSLMLRRQYFDNVDRWVYVNKIF